MTLKSILLANLISIAILLFIFILLLPTTLAFVGNYGTHVVDRSGCEVIEEKRSENKLLLPLQKKSNNGHRDHQKNFLKAIRENNSEILTCNVQDAAHVAKVAQMGNISFKTKQKLSWDINLSLIHI